MTKAVFHPDYPAFLAALKERILHARTTAARAVNRARSAPVPEIIMAKKCAAKITKTVEALSHDAAKRKNIPTAECQSVLQKEEEKPKTIKYPRNADLDRGD